MNEGDRSSDCSYIVRYIQALMEQAPAVMEE